MAAGADLTPIIEGRTIGSSDVTAILGLSRFTTPGEVWGRLVGLVPLAESEDTPAAVTGRWLEQAVIERMRPTLETMTAVVVQGFAHGGSAVLGPEPWAHARPDALLCMRDPIGCVAVIEAKTRRSLHGWGPSGTDQIPADVLVQCTWQALCCEVATVHVGAYGLLAYDYRQYSVYLPPHIRQRLLDVVGEWYRRHVETGTPPMIGVGAELLAKIYPFAGQKVWRQASEESLALVHRGRELRRERQRIDAELGVIRDALCREIGDAYGLEDGDSPLVSWGHVRRKAGSTRQFRYADDDKEAP